MRNYTYVDGGVFIKSKANMAEQYGIGQYRYPFNYELVGKTVTAVADGKEYTLEFACKKNVVFNGKKTEYECIKCAPDLYFVRVGFDVAVIDKKNSAERKPTATQTENVGLKSAILEGMEDGKAYTIGDLMKEVPELADLTNQRVSALMRQLKDDGQVVRTEDKRKAYFSLA